MKKRMIQKLKLNRETLGSLEDKQIENAAGGIITTRPSAQGDCPSISFCVVCHTNERNCTGTTQ